MTEIYICLSVMLVSMIFGGIFFVLFGQITVRKLRKNPETRHDLGSKLVSGWDILNVAQAMALPQSLNDKFEKSPLSFLHADSKLVRQHTTRFDRFLGITFFWLWVVAGVACLVFAIMYELGVK